MASFNKVILVGHLGSSVTLRKLDNGTAAASFNMATNSYAGKDEAGEAKQRTDWHRIVVYGPVAEAASKYLKKGSGVLIEGELRSRDYEKEGETVYIVEVKADVVKFLDKKDDDAE